MSRFPRHLCCCWLPPASCYCLAGCTSTTPEPSCLLPAVYGCWWLLGEIKMSRINGSYQIIKAIIKYLYKFMTREVFIDDTQPLLAVELVHRLAPHIQTLSSSTCHLFITCYTTTTALYGTHTHHPLPGTVPLRAALDKTPPAVQPQNPPAAVWLAG